MFEAPGAVMLLEIRVRPPDAAQRAAAVEESLARVRLVLEAPAPGTRWSPASGPGVSGSIAFAEEGDALPFLHRIRTEVRADPDWPRLDVVAGVGRGGEVDGTRLAGDAFRALGKRGKYRTRVLTADAGANVVLAALCRTLDSLHTGWTRAQWQAVHRRDSGRTLQEIGRELGIAYQNVSKRLIAAQYSLYGEVLDAAGHVFADTASPRA